MKSQLFISTLMLFVFFTAKSQINAVTEKGDEVILKDDGTWIYANNASLLEEKEIQMNPSIFSKPANASFLLKSDKIKVGFWIDPKKWNFKKSSNDVSEFELNIKSGDIYGMAITEKIEIPLLELKNLALENARMAAPDIVLSKEEYRQVNGIKVLHLQMNGTIQGIKFTYLGYYFSNESGTVQFLTYSSNKLMKENQLICESLLNGLVELK